MKHYFKVIVEETTEICNLFISEICDLFICHVFWHDNMQWSIPKGSGHHKTTSNMFYFRIASNLMVPVWF